MRILCAGERPPYPFFLGGAARCAYQLLSDMATRFGVQCAAVGSSEYARGNWRFPEQSEFANLNIQSIKPENGSLNCGYPVQLLPDFVNTLNNYIDEFKPGIVWAQLEGALDVLTLANKKGIQGLYFVHDAGFDPCELRAIADLGCHIVCSSRFLAEKVKKAIGRSCHMIYPASKLYFGTEGRADGKITLINPVLVKGVETFWEIAKRMPELPFLLVESWKLGDDALADLNRKVAALSNVQFLRRVADMRTVYAQSSLLIAPSICQEGFGMVAIEAQSCRIPVIASSRGGLPESVGEGGILIDDYRNPVAWVTAIHSVLNNQADYQSWCERAYQHARNYDVRLQNMTSDFITICQSTPPKKPKPLVRSLRKILRLGALLPKPLVRSLRKILRLGALFKNMT